MGAADRAAVLTGRPQGFAFSDLRRVDLDGSGELKIAGCTAFLRAFARGCP